MAEARHAVYGLINERGELFYVGSTRHISQRLLDHEKRFEAVRPLRHVILAEVGSEEAARECEKALIAAISAVSPTLVNDHHHANRFDPVGRLKRQLRFWLHAGNQRNVERLLNTLNMERGKAT